MDAHKYATYFPPMPEEQFAELVADIKTNGLIEPITLFEGKILDGVHRFKACEEAKVKPEYVEWADSDALRWVLSKNLHRRHLTPAQKAMILIDSGLLSKEPLDTVTGRPSESRVSPSDFMTKDEASEMAGIGESTVTQVKTIAREAPDLVDSIRSGEMGAEPAYLIVRLREKSKGWGAKVDKIVAQIEEGEIGSKVIRHIIQACDVAYKHGDKGRIKELLKTPYNPNTHTAEAETKRQEIAKELDAREKTKRQTMRWEDVPEVASILRTFQNFRKAVPAFIKALDVGKFSPEAKQFLGEKLGELVTEVRGLLKDLEDLKGRL